MQIYCFEIENTPKLSEFELEYRLLDHLVAQMAITGCKICSLCPIESKFYTKLDLS